MDLYEKGALAFANEIAQKLEPGVKTLRKLRKGKLQESNSCPITNTILAACQEPHYVRTGCWIVNAGDTLYERKQYPMPADVRAFVTGFDNHEYPQYVNG